MAQIKEPMYFLGEAMLQMHEGSTGLQSSVSLEDIEHFRNSGKYRDRDAYLSLFSESGEALWIGESSHYLYHPTVAKVIEAYDPESKVIVILRNPADRIFSEYQYYLRIGRENRQFEEFITHGLMQGLKEVPRNIPADNRLNKGYYAKLLRPWLDIFGLTRLKVLYFNQLCSSPAEMCKSVFDWLNVDRNCEIRLLHAERSATSPWRQAVLSGVTRVGSKRLANRFVPGHVRILVRDILTKKHTAHPKMSNQVRQWLLKVYEQDVCTLEAMLDTDLSDWKPHSNE